MFNKNTFTTFPKSPQSKPASNCLEISFQINSKISIVDDRILSGSENKLAFISVSTTLLTATVVGFSTYISTSAIFFIIAFYHHINKSPYQDLLIG